MIKGEYEKLTGIAVNNVCAEHRTPLVVAWHSGEKCWTLRCGEGHYPDSVTRQLSLTQELKAGAEIPEPIKSNIMKGQRRRQKMQGKTQDTREVGLMPNVDLGTGEVLPGQVMRGLAEFAQRFGLYCVLSHVVLMYGKPYITIDGYLYHARREEIPYSLESRPLKGPERTDYQIADGDHCWLSTVTILDPKQTFKGVGIITKGEIEAEVAGKPGVKRYPVVAEKPWQMAQKRAEWQALRRAFPLGVKEGTNEEEKEIDK